MLRDGTAAEFATAFGPRRLMKRLAHGTLSERATEVQGWVSRACHPRAHRARTLPSRPAS